MSENHGNGGKGGKAAVRGQHSFAQGGRGADGVIDAGGDGGDAEVTGDNSRALGGPGGRGGLGKGMRGGDAVSRGDGVLNAGGEGGESNQPDGRGGRGGRSGLFTAYPEGPEFAGWDNTHAFAGYGRGGDGAHSAQYSARLMVIGDILGRTISMYATSAGITGIASDEKMLCQLNERLERDQHAWRVRITDGCFEFYEP
jgi:hypothetical protein